MKSAAFDRFAVILSGICILHCLLAPVLLTLLPILSISAFVEDLVFHQLMLWLVLPTSAVALVLGCRKHRKPMILITGAVGMLMLIIVAFWGHSIMMVAYEKLATTAAGLLLAFSHYLNYKACQDLICNDQNCQTDHHH